MRELNQWDVTETINNMEFYEVINRRRSIRQFQDKPIQQDALESILDAGLKAPSSNHQRQWELVTLTDKSIIKELAKIIKPYPCRIIEPKTPQQEMFKIAFPKQRTMVEEAACVILPFFKLKYDLKSATNDYGLMDFGAAWALIENILLAATAEGLGSVVHIPVKKEPDQIKEFIKSPAGYYLPALVCMGYSITNPEIPAQIKATVENKVHWNKW
jgi:nitroreductase